MLTNRSFHSAAVLMRRSALSVRTFSVRPAPTAAIGNIMMPGEETKTPVTVISGFLGAGKTSFLQHVIHSQTGLKFGLVVNDVANVNVDSKLIKQQTMGSKDGIDTLELQNGCVCCSLAEDLMSSVSKLVAVAEAKNTKYDHIVVECSGVSEPRKIRDLFQEAEFFSSPLLSRVRLDTLITLVDAKVFMDLFGSEQIIKNNPDLAFRAGDLMTQRSFEQDGTALRKVTELLLEQVECADSILVNKCDLLKNQREIDLVQKIVLSINPSAKTLTCTRGKVSDPLVVIGSGEGRGAAARDILREQQQLVEAADKQSCAPDCHEPSHNHHDNHPNVHHCAPGCNDPTHHHDHSHTHEHIHNTQETTAATRFGITSFVYRRRVPFHPVRFSVFLQGLGKLSVKGVEEITSEDLNQQPSKATTSGEDQAIADAVKLAILRSKGFVWMGVSRSAAYFLSHAGQYLELAVLGRWWADMKKEDWPEGVNEQEIMTDFEGVHGDRRQELVFIGIFGRDGGKSQKALEAVLDSCLLTPEEMKGYEKNATYGDPALRDFFFPE